MFYPGDLVECLRDGAPDYYKGHIYEVRGYRPPSGMDPYGAVETVLDSKGSRYNGWDASSFKPYAGMRPAVVPGPPTAVSVQVSTSAAHVMTLPGGYQVYWESAGTTKEKYPAPIANQYCTPKQYVGFTKIDYYCPRCNKKADSELEIATSTCDKA